MFFLPQFTYIKWGTLSTPESIIYDPYFNYTSLIINAESISTGSTNSVFIDSSTNNLPITINGTPYQTSLTPYAPNDWSVHFDGSSRLSAASSVNFQYSTGDFTIEAWVNPTTYSASSAVIYAQSITTNNYLLVGINTVGKLFLYVNNTTQILASNSFIPTNTWTHIAVTRESTATGGVKFFVNGILVNTGTSTFSFATTYSPTIGRSLHTTLSYPFNGHISNVRVIKGQAIYTNTFIPSISALTTNSVGGIGNGAADSITGTVSLLVCQGNTFKDYSTTPKNITTSGTPEIVRFNPFSKYQSSDYSMYLNGSTDRYYLNANTDFNFGAGDFTIECWIYSTSLGQNAQIVSYNKATVSLASDVSFAILKSSTDQIRCVAYNSTTPYDVVSEKILADTWYHVAFVRNGANLDLYLNGIRQLPTTNISTISINTNPGGATPFFLYIGYYNSNETRYFNGNISNLRIIKGQALYTGNFTPSLSSLNTTQVGSSGVGVPTQTITGTVSFLGFQDPNLEMENSRTFKDIVLPAASLPAPIKNSPFLSDTLIDINYGAKFTGGTNNYFSFAANSDFAIGTTFTLEFWYYPLTTRTARIFGSTATTSTVGAWTVFTAGGKISLMEWNSVGAANVYGNNGAETNTSVPLNEWTHVVITKSGTTANNTRIYFNGVSQSLSAKGDAVDSLNFTSTSFAINDFGGDTTRGINGYLSNLRIIKGQVLYTGNFTPPTSKLTRTSVGTTGVNVAANITGIVSFLGLQSPTFIDNSTNPKAMTQNGVISPFRTDILTNTITNTYTTSAYSPNLHGGSIYFNGTTDYLNCAQNNAFEFGTEDFTIEFWFNCKTIAIHPNANVCIRYGQTTWSDYNSVSWICFVNSETVRFYICNGLNVYAVDYQITKVKVNELNHYAAVRQSGILKIFVNGVQGESLAANVSPNTPSGRVLSIAYNASGNEDRFNGFLSDIRIVKGQAVYTGNFTPPTQSLSDIPNTTFLLKANNGAIRCF
jgi:hypothetical protein